MTDSNAQTKPAIDVLMLASASWESPTRVNCHHIASRWGESRGRVLFVESIPLRKPSLSSTSDRSKIFKRALSLLRTAIHPPKQVSQNVWRLTPVPILGKGWLAKIGKKLLVYQIKRALRTLNIDTPVCWTFLPTADTLIDQLNYKKLIYHCVDYYAGNPNVNKDEILKKENRLAKKADLCFATSKPLEQHLKSMGAKAVKLMANVGNVRIYTLQQESNPFFDTIEKYTKIIGYIGNIAPFKIDIPLILNVASRFPGWAFVLVGPIGLGDSQTNISNLQQQPNIFLPGSSKPEDIPSWTAGFDVCWMPMQRTSVSEHSLPLKTFEFLASGKPVVSTPVLAMTQEGLYDVIQFAEDVDDTCDALQNAVNDNSVTNKTNRTKKANAYSWPTRFPQIISSIEQCINR